MKGKRWIPLLFLFAEFTLIALTGCSQKKEKPINEEVIPVQVIPVKKYTIEQKLEFTGNIEPFKKNNLGAQMAGRIQKIYVDAGDRVKKGDLLVQMDDAQLTQARVQYELAKSDYERMKPLLAEGSISQQQFDQIKGRFESTRAAYELILENTRIRAPFDGVVTTRWMNEGEVFTLIPGAAGPPAILTLMQINPVKIIVNVSESDFARIRKGMLAKIRVDVLPDLIFKGKISRLDPAIDPLSRTFGIEITVSNDREILRPGMFARVSILLGKEKVLAVPRSTLIRQVGTSSYYGFVVQKGVAHRREVKRGKTFDYLIEVLQGLQEGEQIVIEGQYRLKDGSKVSIVKTPANLLPGTKREEGE